MYSDLNDQNDEIPLPNDPNEIPLPSTQDETNEEIILNLTPIPTPIPNESKSFKSPIPIAPRPIKKVFPLKPDASNQTLDRLLVLNQTLQSEVQKKIDLIRRRICEIETRSILIQSKIGEIRHKERLLGVRRKKVKWRKQGRDTLASFYKPYFFSRSSSTSPYTDFIRVIDDDEFEYRNPLNEVKETLGQFNGISNNINKSHDSIIKTFVRNENEYKVIYNIIPYYFFLVWWRRT